MKTKFMPRRLWVIEAKDNRKDPWEPTVGVYLSRSWARKAETEEFKPQFKYTRVVPYHPESPKEVVQIMIKSAVLDALKIQHNFFNDEDLAKAMAKKWGVK